MQSKASIGSVVSVFYEPPVIVYRLVNYFKKGYSFVKTEENKDMATKGTCIHCGRAYTPGRMGSHLQTCIPEALPSSASAKKRGGYLVRVSWRESPNLYWMFLAISDDAELGELDSFLREIWLECCGHLSVFVIQDQQVLSHAESGFPSPLMEKEVNQLFTPGLRFSYVYDMGSSTELSLSVVSAIDFCGDKRIVLLGRNDPPVISCGSCTRSADVICSYCSDAICSQCEDTHPCAVDEGDTQMLMSLVNSPRAGVCGYMGRDAEVLHFHL